MIRFTRDGLPIIDPAWQQDELSDRGEPEECDDEEGGEPPIDDHLEAAVEARVSGEVDEDDAQFWSDAPW